MMFARALLIYLAAIFTLVMLIGWLVYWSTMPANSADAEHMRMYHGNPEYSQWMRSLVRPDTGTSCCNFQDCRPTEADFRDGQWWADVLGEWRPIPPEKVVKDPPSIDGEAWVCAMNRTIFCFIPPAMGY